MAKKDYVILRYATGSRCKKKSRFNIGSNLSKSMIVQALSFLIIASIMWLIITYHQKEDTPVINNDKTSRNCLPPMPKERWRYIKELENRQIGVLTATVPTSEGGKTESQITLSNEQRHLLNQMQVDMRQQPTQINKAPRNEHTSAPRQYLQRHTQTQRDMPIIKVTPELLHQQKKDKNIVIQPTTKNQTKIEKESIQGWIIQCGSFKMIEQAESIRAQLAFEGFESRITIKSRWNRVVIGPYKSLSIADSMLRRLHDSDHTNCIHLAVRG